MLIIHPIIQFSAIVLALYVFYLGIHRFRFLHLRQRTTFRWKRHVTLGVVAMVAWLAGMLGGLTIVYRYWNGVLITGTHGKVALLMVPLIIFGISSGLYMNRKKKKRALLPLIHGVNNLLVLILALSQIVTGWGVYNAFVLGN